MTSGERDPLQHLLGQRIVFVRGTLDAHAGDLAIAQFLHLDGADPGREISLYINVPESDLRASLAVYDVVQTLRSPVRTLCLGTAAGGATLVLAGGAPGRRGCLPAARVSFYEPRREIGGTIGEIDVRARELLRLRQQVHELLARHTGQPVERIERDAGHAVWLSAEEAKAYGIIDEIVLRAGSDG